MPKFQMDELLSELAAKSTRLGSGVAQAWGNAEVGKCVKLAGDSRFDLCVAGDGIEAFVDSVEQATLDNYSFGAVRQRGRKRVVADGLQATPGTGSIAVGDYVVAGTMVAKGTALATYQKVCKATFQPQSEAAAVTDVNDMLKAVAYPWRVVAILNAGTGAVGDTLVIERMQ